jgi:predicted TIM-barrel fold metal-dependent hydrolase
MEVIDAQVHAFDRDRPERPWDPAYDVHRSPHVLPAIDDDAMLAAMQAAGVDAAVLVATSHYGWDNSYSLGAAARRPERFRVVGRVDHEAADVADRVAEFAAHDGAVGLRLFVRNAADHDRLAAGGYDLLLRAMADHDLAVFVFSPGRVGDVETVARFAPGLRVVVDHLGLAVPEPGVTGVDHFADLPAVLTLARRPNVVVKLTGVPALSTGPFPFADVWPHLRRVIDAFGPGRLMWGTDWTRVPNATYEQGVRYLRDSGALTDGEKAELMGATLRRVLRWPAPA